MLFKQLGQCGAKALSLGRAIRGGHLASLQSNNLFATYKVAMLEKKRLSLNYFRAAVKVTEMNEIAITWGMEITRDQCRAARGILRMSQQKLARAAGVGVSTVTDFELGSREISPRLIHMIRIALEREGVMFDDNGGVKPIPGWRK